MLEVGPDFLRHVEGELIAGLAALDARAILVLARSGKETDLAPFVGPVKLAGSLLVVPRPPVGSPARGFFAYLTPMERDEAAATGWELVTPEQLELERLNRQLGGGELLAAIVAKALQRAGIGPGRVAVAGSHAAGTWLEAADLLRGDGFELVSASQLVRRLRKHKTARQQVAARTAARGVVDAFYRVAELLSGTEVRAGELWANEERVTVGRVRGEAAMAFARLGLEQPEGGIIAPAEEGAVPHNPGRDERVLRPGESLIVDLYPRGWVFADCTRTFCVGPAPAALAAAHEAVREGLQLARRLAVPGALGWDLQVAVCELLGARGYPTPVSQPGTTRGYVHGLGHGVGFELHELPTFAQRSEAGDGLLENGDVITLEPGIYEPEQGFAVRLEDMCALDGEGRLVDLTPLPYALDPRAWLG